MTTTTSSTEVGTADDIHLGRCMIAKNWHSPSKRVVSQVKHGKLFVFDKEKGKWSDPTFTGNMSVYQHSYGKDPNGVIVHLTQNRENLNNYVIYLNRFVPYEFNEYGMTLRCVEGFFMLFFPDKEPVQAALTRLWSESIPTSTVPASVPTAPNPNPTRQNPVQGRSEMEEARLKVSDILCAGPTPEQSQSQSQSQPRPKPPTPELVLKPAPELPTTPALHQEQRHARSTPSATATPMATPTPTPTSTRFTHRMPLNMSVPTAALVSLLHPVTPKRPESSGGSQRRPVTTEASTTSAPAVLEQPATPATHNHRNRQAPAPLVCPNSFAFNSCSDHLNAVAGVKARHAVEFNDWVLRFNATPLECFLVLSQLIEREDTRQLCKTIYGKLFTEGGLTLGNQHQ